MLRDHKLPAPAGSHGGNNVTVEGSFDNWSTRHVMQRSGKDFTIVKLLPPGVYQARTHPLTHPNLHGMLLLRSAQLHAGTQGPLHCYGPQVLKCWVVTRLAWLCRKAEVCVSAAGAQYKFIVDGDWKYAPDQPAMYDEDNNVNNVLEVQEYVPENLASLSSFDPPPSPPERSASAMCWLRACLLTRLMHLFSNESVSLIRSVFTWCSTLACWDL